MAPKRKASTARKSNLQVARDVLSIKRRKSTTLKENSDVGEDSNSEVEGTEEKV